MAVKTVENFSARDQFERVFFLDGASTSWLKGTRGKSEKCIKSVKILYRNIYIYFFYTICASSRAAK